jgi:hypothetical protein
LLRTGTGSDGWGTLRENAGELEVVKSLHGKMRSGTSLKILNPAMGAKGFAATFVATGGRDAKTFSHIRQINQ